MTQITCYEPFNSTVANVIRRGKGNLPPSEYAKFKAWERAANGQSIEVQYTDGGLGRLNVNLISSGHPTGKGISMGLFRADLRAAFSQNLEDYDMTNCHPVLVSQLCFKNEIDCPNLNHYNQHRSEYFQKFGNEFKKQVLRWINGGMHKFHDETKPMYDEIQIIMEKLIGKLHPKDCDEIKKISNLKTRYQKMRSLRAKAVQDIEKKVLVSIYNAFVKQNVNPVCLIFDGLLIPSDVKFNMEQLVQDVKMDTDFKIELEKKPIPPFNHSEWEDTLICGTDYEGAKIFLELHPKIIRALGEIWILEQNLWKVNNNTIKRLIMEADIQKLDGNGEARPYSQNITGCNNIFKALESIVQEDTDFINRINRLNINKVHYLNGYYDLALQKFVPGEFESLVRIDREFKAFDYSYNHPQIEELIDKVISAIRPEEQRFALTSLARAIGGNFGDKRWFINTGCRNSGKGTLEKLTQETFGNYVTTIPALGAKGAVSDIAKSLSWLLSCNCHIARIAYCNELQTVQGKEVPLDGNTCKACCSGGDYQVVRTNYKDEVKIINNATIFFNLNNVPASDPPDAIKTAMVIPFTYSYVEATPIHDNERPAFEVKDWINENKDWIPGAFEWMVYQYWQPQKPTEIPELCHQYKDAICEDVIATPVDLLNKFFIRSQGDCVPSQSINDLFKEKLKYTPQKVKLFMEKSGYPKDRRRLDGSSNPVHCYLNLKFKSEELDDFEPICVI